MTEEITLAARLLLDAQNYVRGLAGAESKTREFAAATTERFKRLGEGMARGLGLELAALKVGMAGVESFKDSAARDKSMNQIAQKANWVAEQTRSARASLTAIGIESGASFDELTESLGIVVDKGTHKLDEALVRVGAIDQAIKVAGGSTDVWAGALSAAADNFGMLIKNGNDAKRVLDSVIGATQRGGHLDAGSLATVLAGKGTYLHAAGFNFNDSANLAEQLSVRENDPGQVALAMKNISMLFGNAKRMVAAQKAAGVHFFNKSGAQNDPLEILSSIQHRMAGIKTDQKREAFLEKVFRGTGQRQLISLREAMAVDPKSGFNPITEALKYSRVNSDGMIDRLMPGAMDNAVDQGARFKNVFGAMVDKVAQPINKVLADGIQKLIDPKEKGGLGLTGGDMLEGLAGAAGSAWLIKKLGGKVGGSLVRRLAGLGADAGAVVQGAVLHEIAGVTPVFVTNWPGSPGGSTPGGSAVEHVAEDAAVAVAARARGLWPFLASIGTRLSGPLAALAISGDTPNKFYTAADAKRAKAFNAQQSEEIAHNAGYRSAAQMNQVAQALLNANSAKASHAEAMKHWDVMHDGTPQQKAELRILIDNQGNAKVTGMNQGSFGEIVTEVRNSPLGRMMSSL